MLRRRSSSRTGSGVSSRGATVTPPPERGMISTPLGWSCTAVRPSGSGVMTNEVPGGSGTSATTGGSTFSCSGARSEGNRASSHEATCGTQ